jgi:hypothetical protein
MARVVVRHDTLEAQRGLVKLPRHIPRAFSGVVDRGSASRGLEVMTLFDVRDQLGLGRLPAEALLGKSAGGGIVGRKVGRWPVSSGTGHQLGPLVLPRPSGHRSTSSAHARIGRISVPRTERAETTALPLNGEVSGAPGETPGPRPRRKRRQDLLEHVDSSGRGRPLHPRRNQYERCPNGVEGDNALLASRLCPQYVSREEGGLATTDTQPQPVLLPHDEHV